jgi:hypothetical protein
LLQRKISKENERYVSAGFQKWFGPVTAIQLQFPPLKIGLLVALGPMSVSVLYLGEYWPGNVCLWAHIEKICMYLSIDAQFT